MNWMIYYFCHPLRFGNIFIGLKNIGKAVYYVLSNVENL